MHDYLKYGIAKGQMWEPADGSRAVVEVTDVDTYADCGDVVVKDHQGVERRIDAFKLAKVRYKLRGT